MGKENWMAEGKAKIMIVDDESMVTTSLGEFFKDEGDYDVLTFNEAQAALKALGDQPVDLIIADFLMPEMDGVEFLAQAAEVSPETTRIILTGYADKENAIRAINEVGIFYYLEKPWDLEDLKLIVQSGLERRQLLADLEQKVQQLSKMSEELWDSHGRLLGVQWRGRLRRHRP